MRISDWSSDVCSSDLHVIGDLVDDLVALLQARGIGLRTAVLTCLRVDGGEQRIGLGTAKATREPKHLKRMLAMRIEQIEPGRSEDHTSELQSLMRISYADFCLKKKNSHISPDTLAADEDRSAIQ